MSVASAGPHTLEFRVASAGTGGTFHLEVDGADVTGPLSIPDTGGWQFWTTVTRGSVMLPAGPQVWTLIFDRAGPGGVHGNINYIRASSGGGAAGGSMPFGESAAGVPGRIEAENYDSGGPGVAYFDATSMNDGGVYRGGGVDLESTTDEGGGANVGWMSPGEWLNYTIAVSQSGFYDIDLRLASLGSGGWVRIEIDGAGSTSSVNVPETGDWQSWTTVRAGTVWLEAGQHLMRLVVEEAGGSGWAGNLNWILIR